MAIKAVLRNGVIEPLEPLPAAWSDGRELVVEEGCRPVGEGELAAWVEEIEAAARRIPAEEHERFLRALEEGERESNGRGG